MNEDRTILRDGRVITMDPELGDFDRADVLIEGSEIAGVGPDLEAGGARVMDASGMIVMPGLVDAHRHTWQGAIPHIAPDATLGDYVGRVLGALATRYRPEDVYAGNLWGALSALDAGITTIMDWSHIQNTPEHTDEAIRGLRESGARAVFAYGFPALGPEWFFESQLLHPEDARRIRSRHFQSDEGLVTMAMALRGPEMATMEVTRHDWALARELGLRISVHVGNGSFGVQYRAVERMHEAGLMGPDVQYVHNTSLTDEAIELIGETGGMAVVTPAVELQMGFGWPATNRLLARGVPTGLGVDVVTSTGADLFGQMRAALQVGRALALADGAGEAAVPTSRDVLELATTGGARAIGLGNRIGALAPGKQADVLLIRADHPNVAPATDPVATVVLGADTGSVDSVFVAGRAVKRGGRLLHPRLDRARRLAGQSGNYLLGKAGAQVEVVGGLAD